MKMTIAPVAIFIGGLAFWHIIDMLKMGRQAPSIKRPVYIIIGCVTTVLACCLLP